MASSNPFLGGQASPLLRQKRAIRAHLARGGLVAYPTASCYGLGCDPLNYRAIRRLLRLKGRTRSKGLIVIGSRQKQLAPYVARLPAATWEKAAATWPGPHTWLMPASRKTPAWLRGAHDSIAVRVDAHPDAARLCHALGYALVSTSANRSGRQSLKTYRQVARAFGRRVLVRPGRIGGARAPSTIHDVRTGRRLR